MKAKHRFFRLVYTSLIFAALWAAWVTTAGAAPPARNDVEAREHANGLPDRRAAPPALPEQKPQPAPLRLAGGSTVSGTLTANDTWGPGVITVTGDITITPGVVITVAANTTVQMNYTDSLKSGVDVSRTEWIISGTLQTSGPVTFTSQAASPAPADWYGLRVMRGGQLTLDGATIEYAIFGVTLDNNGPVQIENSTIRYMTNDDGPNTDQLTAGICGDQSTSGDPASTILISNTQIYSITGQAGLDEAAGGPTFGASAYGILLAGHPITPVLFTPTLQANIIYSITSGRGGDIDVGAIPQAGDGGEAFGINLQLDGDSPTTLVSNTIHHVTSGRGGDVTAPVPNAAGGFGGQTYGIFINGNYSPASVVSNTIHSITGGRGGDGGWDVPSGWPGVSVGADAMGIGLVSLLQADVRANTVLTITAGAGGDGMDGPDGAINGGPGGDAGPGGSAYGIMLDDFVTTTLPIYNNTVREVRAGAGGDGGQGGDGDTATGSNPNGGAGGSGGPGGDAYGLFSSDYSVPFTFTANPVEQIYGGDGGRGGDGGAAEGGSSGASGGPGADGGPAGYAYGLMLRGNPFSTPAATVDAQSVSRVWGGDGGTGGSSGWSEDEGISWPGGDGGAGGGAWGILAQSTVALIHDGDILFIFGGAGGPGGDGNDVAAENSSASPGPGGGPGGDGGSGGRATGVEVQSDGSLVDPTSARSIWGGRGGNGGDGGEDDETRATTPTGDALGGDGGRGGVGGAARGYYNNGGARVTFREVNTIQVNGGDGGDSGDGGRAIGAASGIGPATASGGRGLFGGAGGAAYGLHTTGLTPTVELLKAYEITGGAGGPGGRGGDAQDENIIQSPPGGAGGPGGIGGPAYGLRNESGGTGGRLYDNETYRVTGGNGGAGGRGGDGAETAPVPLLLFITGGRGGHAAPGGHAWGLLNQAITATLVARTTAYSITAGSGITGGNGGDINYVSVPAVPVFPGNGGPGGAGGSAYGVDSAAQMENNLAYRAYGSTGGAGGDSGLDLTILAPTASGGAGGDGGDGVTLRTDQRIRILNNTAVRTRGGAPGAPGFGLGTPSTPGNPGTGIGIRVTGSPPGSAFTVNNAVISHTAGITGNRPAMVAYSFISATTNFGSNVFDVGNNITNTAPGFVDWPNDNYHLTGCAAPAVEAGALAPLDRYEDGDGELRPWGFFDVGYDEYWCSPLTAVDFQGVITQDTTWSGDYLLTGDVVITPGVTLTVSPGATIYANATDLNNLGVDQFRIELIVSGTLHVGASGGLTTTFTVTGCNPAPGQWHGIRFEPGSAGYLDPTIIEYGTHGVVISTTNPVTIADSIIRYNLHAPSIGPAWGAGVAIFTGTHLVTNTEIYSNSLLPDNGDATGAGVYLVDGDTLFENSAIHDNHINLLGWGGLIGYGGGLALLDGAPTLQHDLIYRNVVSSPGGVLGGGVFIRAADALIEADTIIHTNWLTSIMGSTTCGAGVCVSSEGANPAPIIRDSSVTSNTCYVEGDWCIGGGIGIYNGNTRAVVSNTLIAGNVNKADAPIGGGIGMSSMSYDATADSFTGNVIRDNLAYAFQGGEGGGLGLYAKGVTVTNNLIFDNLVYGDDTAMTNNSSSGGGMFASGPVYLANNTVVSNAVVISGTTAQGYGGGVYLDYGAVLSNTIVVSNSAQDEGGGIYTGGYFTGSMGYNDVWSNTPQNYSGTITTAPFTDISADPLFVGAGDLATSYHLQQGSPCLDAGTGAGAGIPTTDYDSQSRPLGAGWDIGFDEVQPLTYTKSPTQSIAYLGETLVYTIHVSNPDPIAPATFHILDELPPEIEYQSCHASSSACTFYAPDSVWWNDSIASNSNLTLIITSTVKKGLADGLTFTNAATITVNGYSYRTNVVTGTVNAPVLTITKRADGGAVAGGALTYTLTVTNSGAGGATDVVITDTVPTDAHYLSGGTLMAGGWVSWTQGLVAAGSGTAQVTFAVTICRTTITNTAYRVVTSTQWVGSGWGPALVTHLGTPNIAPDFTVNPSQAPVGYVVEFAGASSTDGSAIAAWGWDFGDGHTGSGASVGHAYATTGTFTVTLTVTDSCGYTGAISRANAVTVVQAMPVFAVGKQASGAPVAGAPFTYTIVVTNSGNQVGTGVVVTDAVPAHGYYVSGGTESGGVVSLTVGAVPTTTPTGVTWVVSACQASLTNEWYRVVGSDQGVGSGWGPALATALAAPTITPDFSWVPQSPGAADVVTFTGSVATNGGAIAAWGWDFGDGGAATGQTATHSFSAVGSYTVTLTVTDTCGYSAQVEKQVAVASCQPVQADFGWTTPALLGESMTFTVALTAGTPPITYTWAWGDGTAATVTALTATQHTYTISGTVHVSLSAQNGCTNQVVATHDVLVEPIRIYLPLVLKTYP